MLPTHYMVRDIRIEPAVVLAPMEGVTDLTFRRLIRSIGGSGLTCTEFIASEGLKRGVGKMFEMARFDPDERPISVQIYGRNPQSMAEAARIVQDMGADICDINMGCPSKKVCAHSGGSALMRDPHMARQIVAAVRKAIHIPLTVKMRSGFDARARNAPEVAWICQEEGAEALAIHWRTRTDLYGGVRAVDKIAEAKAKVSIPVVGNGDIIDIESARQMVADTGVDGLMVGRGAMRNPWLLLQIAQAARGEPIIEVSAEERRRVLLGYLATLAPQYTTEHAALGRFKRVANYFTRGLPYGGELRTRLLRSQSVAQARGMTNAWFTAYAAYQLGDAEAFHRLPPVPGKPSARPR